MRTSAYMTSPGWNSSRDNFQLGPNDRVETCPGMKIRTIPHVNNPPDGHRRFSENLRKPGENVHESPPWKFQKNKRHAPWPCRLRRGPYLYMYKTSTFFSHLLLLVMLLRRNDGYSCSSQFSFCFSFCQSTKQGAIRIEDTHTNLVWL